MRVAVPFDLLQPTTKDAEGDVLRVSETAGCFVGAVEVGGVFGGGCAGGREGVTDAWSGAIRSVAGNDKRREGCSTRI
ncbi:hypothetical protein BHE74_00041141 [Ensete ventricosum]|nr:hypothetical protein BHE74_00041141 [Ensete ventricosum]